MVAMLWLLAPTGWFGRGYALLLLLPVLSPVNNTITPTTVTVPVYPAQPMLVLQHGNGLLPIVTHPRQRTLRSIQQWCLAGSVNCQTFSPPVTFWGDSIRWQGGWLEIIHKQIKVVFIPKATMTRVMRLVYTSQRPPRLVIYAAPRQTCYQLAQQLHRAFPASVIVSKGCAGGGRLQADLKSNILSELAPGFYSTVRNGSITIGLS